MPFIWTRIPSSPARARRDEVREICRRHGVRLLEEETYYDADGNANALIEVSGPGAELPALVAELRAHSWVGLVSADEHEDGAHPPDSKP